MLPIRVRCWLTLFLVFLAARSYGQAPQQDMQLRLRTNLSYLADDERQGRGVGTQGLFEAGEFIAAKMSENGLNTALFAGTPFQEFTVSQGHSASSTSAGKSHNSLALSCENSGLLELGVHWNPLALGANGSFSGDIVFAGYGITAKDQNYDDYAGIDVSDKVVIVLRKEPVSGDGKSLITANQLSRHAYFSTKELNAAVHRAAALILVNDVGSALQTDDRLLEPSEGGQAISSDRIPTIHVSRSVIDPLVQRALGKSLHELELQINTTGQPASHLLSGQSASGQTHVIAGKQPVRNVIGMLPGQGELASEYVVLGAHYDHVGMGGEGSLAPGTIAVHNGADDNASGTVCLLEASRQLSTRMQNYESSRRTLIFIAFAAEERGLLGSEHYVRHPAFPLENTIAMVNLDMVGRLEDNWLTIFGTGTAAEFSSHLDRANATIGLTLNKQSAGLGPSDHHSFYLRKIPVLHFFTGLHHQYHRPNDDIELINYQGLEKITGLVANVVEQLASSPERLTMIETSERANIAATRQQQRRRIQLGVTCADGPAQCCVLSIIQDSPAAEAGIQVGDVISSFNQRQIQTSEDLVNALQQLPAPQEVDVQLIRNQTLLEIRVRL